MAAQGGATTYIPIAGRGPSGEVLPLWLRPPDRWQGRGVGVRGGDRSVPGTLL